MLSNLTAEQRNILQTMLPGLELAADMAHARVTIYLQDADKRWLNIYSQEQPLTQLGTQQPNLTGRRVRCVEEPLVCRALQQNIVVKGMREMELGLFSNFSVYPLRDLRGKCFGALSFQAVDPDDIIIEQAVEFVLNLRKPPDKNNLYKRLTPADGLLVVDKNKIIIAANNKAKHLFQLMDVKDLIGKRTNHLIINWPLIGMVIDTGVAESKEFTTRGLLLSMRVLPVVPKPNSGCAIVILQDITELRKKDEELLIKSVVIKEIHHRVKNNLQTIASLLRLQERRAQSDETKLVLRDCIGRVNSIAIVHEYLSQQDTGMIDVDKVAKGIYQAIISSMLAPDFRLEASFTADEVQLSSEKATSIALILNELLQNCIEHAFEGRSNGKLVVRFTDEGEFYHLSISDDGVGLPEGFDPQRSKSLGLKIIKTMVEADLHGSFSQKNLPEGGVQALVIIPKGGVGKC